MRALMTRSLRFVVPMAVMLAGAAGAARAQTVNLRAFAGLGSGLGAEAWTPGEHVRIDAEAATAFPEAFDLGGLGVAIPLRARGRSFFGARAGYQVEYLGLDGANWRGSRWAQGPDVGFVGHLEAAGGSAFEAQAGVEALFRQQATVCCDDAALRTDTTGFRLLLRGDLALTSTFALYAEAGLRTADHLLEIKVLPTLWGGVRVRL
jgi:hypothetical protein